jgi:hypothetical protein
MALIETGNVIYDPYPPHLASDGLKKARSEAILIAERLQVRHDLAFGVFQLDEYGQEDLLLVSAPWT